MRGRMIVGIVIGVSIILGSGSTIVYNKEKQKDLCYVPIGDKVEIHKEKDLINYLDIQKHISDLVEENDKQLKFYNDLMALIPKEDLSKSDVEYGGRIFELCNKNRLPFSYWRFLSDDRPLLKIIKGTKYSKDEELGKCITDYYDAVGAFAWPTQEALQPSTSSFIIHMKELRKGKEHYENVNRVMGKLKQKVYFPEPLNK